MEFNLFLKDKDSKTIIVKENMYGLHDEFKYFTVEKRLILYLSFLLANLFVAFLLFWLLTFIFATSIFR